MSTQRMATLTVDGKSVEFPVMKGTHGNDVIDIRTLGAKTGLSVSRLGDEGRGVSAKSPARSGGSSTSTSPAATARPAASRFCRAKNVRIGTTREGG